MWVPSWCACAGHTGAVDGEYTSRYTELPPPPELRDYVECLWVHEVGPVDGTFAQPILPDGCVDVVAVDDRVVLAGPATRSTVLDLPPGTVTVGARFRTGAAPALIGVSAADLRDADHRLDAVWGRAGARLVEQVGDQSTWQARLRVIAGELAARLPSARPLDPVGLGIGPLLDEQPGRSLGELAVAAGLSERQLRRRVEDAVGYAPRTLARILRFQRFLRAARAAGPGRHLARLAADAGYADQAHLTRESRDLSGLPPAALLRWEDRRVGGGRPERSRPARPVSPTMGP